MQLLNKVLPCLEMNNENVCIFPHPWLVKTIKGAVFFLFFQAAESVSKSLCHLLLLEASVIAQSPIFWFSISPTLEKQSELSHSNPVYCCSCWVLFQMWSETQKDARLYSKAISGRSFSPSCLIMPSAARSGSSSASSAAEVCTIGRSCPLPHHSGLSPCLFFVCLPALSSFPSCLTYHPASLCSCTLIVSHPSSLQTFLCFYFSYIWRWKYWIILWWVYTTEYHTTYDPVLCSAKEN